MFWRFGGYANVSTLNNLLEKPDVTVEEVLDESDLIQELKQSNSKLIEYLRDENILRKLLEYVTAPQKPRPEDDGEESEEEPVREKSMSPFRRKERKEKSKRQEDLEEWDKEDKARSKNAYTATEVLSSETWSILESLMENQQLLKNFWDYLKQDTPLDPTEAGNFTKINETLLDKKTEEMIKFLQGLEGIVPTMLKHIDCAAIMDLLLKIISLEKSEGGYGVVDVSSRHGFFQNVCHLLMTSTVVAERGSHPSIAYFPGASACSRHADISRRFYEGNRHHLSECVAK